MVPWATFLVCLNSYFDTLIQYCITCQESRLPFDEVTPTSTSPDVGSWLKGFRVCWDSSPTLVITPVAMQNLRSQHLWNCLLHITRQTSLGSSSDDPVAPGGINCSTRLELSSLKTIHVLTCVCQLSCCVPPRARRGSSEDFCGTLRSIHHIKSAMEPVKVTFRGPVSI